MSPAAPRMDAALWVDDDGIAWIAFDRPESDRNLLDTGALRWLDELLEVVEAGAAVGAIRGLVLRSAKAGCFVVGADVDELPALRTTDEAVGRAFAGQRVLRRLEVLRIPTVALIDGECLGGGTELALACAYRLASDTPETRIGLPEIRLGIIPGLGATVRLPRLVGTQGALTLVATGEPADARRARELGIVDELLSPPDAEARAHRFVLDRIERGRLRTGARRGFARRLLDDTAPGRRLIFARTGARRTAADADPVVVRRAVEAVAEGVGLPLDRAFQRAAEIHGELAVSERARGLLHAYRLDEGAPRPAGLARGPTIERTAVLGAGSTGCAAAFLLLGSGINVRLRDRSHPATIAGVRQVLDWVEEAARGASGGRARLAAARERLRVGTGFGGLGTADLALVAVGADPRAVVAALVEAEEHTSERCIVAVVGDHIPLAALAQASARPAGLVGLRLAQPVDRFSLLEIEPVLATAPATLGTIHDLARRLGRTPLLRWPGSGGVLERLLAAYFSEALRMLEEGVAVGDVDGAAEAFGCLAGPLRRIDSLGPARAARLLERFGSAPDARVQPSALLARMVEAQREARVSFYRYREGRVDAAAGARAGGGGEGAAAVIQDRLLFLMLAVAADMVDEGAASAEEIDLASVAGVGFPRARGGLMYHAGRLGTEAVLARLAALEERFGDRFRPTAGLSEPSADTAVVPAEATGQGSPSLLS